MDERTNVRDHIIKFNKCITDEKDQVIILLASLVESYVTIEITLWIGKTTMIVDRVLTAFLENKSIKQLISSSHIIQAFVMNFESRRGRSYLSKRYHDWRDDRSRSHFCL